MRRGVNLPKRLRKGRTWRDDGRNATADECVEWTHGRAMRAPTICGNYFTTTSYETRTGAHCAPVGCFFITNISYLHPTGYRYLTLSQMEQVPPMEIT
jgi:hypothetical protein